jgi:hypothetical protein
MKFLGVLLVLVSNALGCIRVHSNIEVIVGIQHSEIEIFDDNEFYCKISSIQGPGTGEWQEHCENERYRYVWNTRGAVGQWGYVTKFERATGTKDSLCSCLTYHMFNNYHV